MTAPAQHYDPPFEPVPHRVVATWPVGTFIEDIAVLHDCRFALSIHNQRRLLQVDRAGETRDWAQLSVSPAGLIAYGAGVLAVGGEVGEAPHYNAHSGFTAVVVRPWTQVLPKAEPGSLARTRDDERASQGAWRWT